MSHTPITAAPWWRSFRSMARVTREDTNAPVARQRLLFSMLIALLAMAIIVAVSRGAYAIAPLTVIQILLAPLGIELDAGATAQQAAVLWSIRLPRVLLGVLLGAGLAISGAMTQGLFRNPLADPGLIGMTGGAALAAAFVIVVGVTAIPGMAKILGGFTLPVAAFCGCLVTTLIIYRLATINGLTVVSIMLLAGVAVNAMAGAGIGSFTFIATDEQLRTLTFWTLGSLAPAHWGIVAIVAACVGLACVFGFMQAAPLNALALGEAEAGHLGVPLQRLKMSVIVLAALAVGSLVAFCGMVGFIGLIAPHGVRMIGGPDHRVVLPGAALLGAILAVSADTVARTVVAPAELPVGIVTAFIGAPLFIYLLLRQRKGMAL